jgi:hypothetical protein
LRSEASAADHRLVGDMALISDLASRFGLYKRPNDLVGHIDGVFAGALRGWVDAGGPTPASVIIRKNGEVLGHCQANQFRADLIRKGIGNGRCGFSLALLKNPEITLGDVLELEEAHAPNRKLSLTMTAKVFNKTLGSVELLAPDRVAGWVYLPWQPKRRLNVEVRIGNRSVATAPANLDHRLSAGLSDGHTGFEIELDGARDLASMDEELSVHCIESHAAIPISENARSSGTEAAGQGERTGRAHKSAGSAATAKSANGRKDNSGAEGSPETLRKENERLRMALSDRESELAMTRLQLQQLQEEMEHWFLQNLELQKSLSKKGGFGPRRPRRGDDSER